MGVATEETAATAAEIGRQIEGSSKVAKDAVAQTTSTDQSMVKLAVAADKVGSIIGMITAIAEQTNLLALNATIEAARAGARLSPRFLRRRSLYPRTVGVSSRRSTTFSRKCGPHDPIGGLAAT
jgi:hypothetical protein